MSERVLITGSTDGIGKQTALDFLKLGYGVIIHGRDDESCLSTLQELLEHVPNGDLSHISADLNKKEEIEKMSEVIHHRYQRIDMLINNAGVYSQERSINELGIEKTFMVNYLSHFYLTLLLLDLIKAGRSSRIVNVSSMVHSATIDFDNLQGEKGYDGRNAYGLSKLANILFTNKLSKILVDSNITVNSLHPGVIATKLAQHGWNIRGSTVDKGSRTILYVATSNEGEEKSGIFFSNMQESTPKKVALDEDAQDKLWEISAELLKLDISSLI